MPDLNKSVVPFNSREINSKAIDWLKTFIGMAEINKWSDSLKIKSVRANLCGPAQQWFRSRLFSSWEEFEQQFTRLFVGISNRTKLLDNTYGMHWLLEYNPKLKQLLITFMIR